MQSPSKGCSKPGCGISLRMKTPQPPCHVSHTHSRIIIMIIIIFMVKWNFFCFSVCSHFLFSFHQIYNLLLKIYKSSVMHGMPWNRSKLSKLVSKYWKDLLNKYFYTTITKNRIYLCFRQLLYLITRSHFMRTYKLKKYIFDNYLLICVSPLILFYVITLRNYIKNSTVVRKNSVLAKPASET